VPQFYFQIIQFGDESMDQQTIDKILDYAKSDRRSANDVFQSIAVLIAKGRNVVLCCDVNDCWYDLRHAVSAERFFNVILLSGVLLEHLFWLKG